MPTTDPGSSVDSPEAISTLPAIEIRSLAPDDDATAFRTLSTECDETIGSARCRLR